MKKINVKCELPANMYTLRSFKLKFDGGIKHHISLGGERTFEFEQKNAQLSARIDFLSQKLDLDNSEDEIYIVLGMRGNNMFEWFLNGLYPRGLMLKQVDRNDYLNYGPVHYSSNVKTVRGVDSYTLFIVALLSVGMIYQGIQFSDVHDGLTEFLYSTSFISIATISRLYFKKSATEAWAYMSNFVIISSLMVIAIIWAGKYGLALAGLWVQVPILIVLRSLVYVKTGARKDLSFDSTLKQG